MRRHRRIRTGYRSGTKKKSVKKIIIRVLFVIACVIALTAFSVFLGSYLKDKAESAESLLMTEETQQTVPEESVEIFPDGIPSTSDAASIRVCAASIDILSETPDSINSKLDTLSEKYNAVSVNIVSEEGQLIYLSRALLDYVGLDPNSVVELPITQNISPETSTEDENTDTSDNTAAEIDALGNITALLAKADEKSLRTGAVFAASSDVLSDDLTSYASREIDSVVLGELNSLGFDEVIITGLVSEDESVSHELLKSIISYLAVLRKNSDKLDIGVMLPASVYLIPQSASIIKSLSEYVDFLAIAISTDAEEQSEAYSAVYDNCHSLKGNFSVYNIRGVITSLDPDISLAVYAALSDLSATSVQFSTFVENPVYAPKPVTDETAEIETDMLSNENAKRKESYNDETEITDTVTDQPG